MVPVLILSENHAIKKWRQRMSTGDKEWVLPTGINVCTMQSCVELCYKVVVKKKKQAGIPCKSSYREKDDEKENKL